MCKPTNQDAELIFDILEHVRSPRFQEAQAWFRGEFSAATYEEFAKKYPLGGAEYNDVTFVLGFYEILATLVTHELLNEDLFFDIGFGFQNIWDKVAPIIPGWQKAASPVLWENYAWLVKRGQEWAKTEWTPSLEWKLQKM